MPFPAEVALWDLGWRGVWRGLDADHLPPTHGVPVAMRHLPDLKYPSLVIYLPGWLVALHQHVLRTGNGPTVGTAELFRRMALVLDHLPPERLRTLQTVPESLPPLADS